MPESHFWVHLEFRVAREFQGLPQRRYRYFWCDGLLPDQYVLDDPRPRILGEAWICNGQAQDRWEFTLLLPERLACRGTIKWRSLLPPENVTCWMSFDEARKRIEFDPGAAIPDLF